MKLYACAHQLWQILLMSFKNTYGVDVNLMHSITFLFFILETNFSFSMWENFKLNHVTQNINECVSLNFARKTKATETLDCKIIISAQY